MRISTNTLYQNGITKISDLQAQQSKLQQQISTGRRILSPSDDPVNSARALELMQSQSVNNQYLDNSKTAQSKLGNLEGTLSSISDLLTSTKSSLVEAGSDALSDTERQFISSELRGTLDQLIGLANSKDSFGQYMFAGFKTDAPAFVKSATGATYQGDNGQQQLQVAAGRQMPVGETGATVFQANGVDLFKTLNDLADLLATPVNSPAAAAALHAGLVSNSDLVDKATNNLLNVRASVGSRLKELDALDVANQDRNVQYTQSLSEAQDLDYAKAISDLSQQQTVLQAAQQSFVKTVGLSLFDLLR